MIIQGFEQEGLIKVDNVRVYGLDESILASGYPMMTHTIDMDNVEGDELDSLVEETDIKRAKHLGKAIPGSGHDCYLKGITVQFDLQVSEYIWRQLDRYHFIDYVSSQSKMHRILKLDINEVCNKYVHKENILILNDMINAYNDFENFKKEALDINKGNRLELRTGEKVEITKENIFNMIIANTPCGIMLTARMTTNYLQLKSMIAQRENHKMQEWRMLCDYLKTLPMVDELVIRNK